MHHELDATELKVLCPSVIGATDVLGWPPYGLNGWSWSPATHGDVMRRRDSRRAEPVSGV